MLHLLLYLERMNASPLALVVAKTVLSGFGSAMSGRCVSMDLWSFQHSAWAVLFPRFLLWTRMWTPSATFLTLSSASLPRGVWCHWVLLHHQDCQLWQEGVWTQGFGEACSCWFEARRQGWGRVGLLFSLFVSCCVLIAGGLLLYGPWGWGKQ